MWSGHTSLGMDVFLPCVLDSGRISNNGETVIPERRGTKDIVKCIVKDIIKCIVEITMETSSKKPSLRKSLVIVLERMETWLIQETLEP